jgi:hypothetical protein
MNEESLRLTLESAAEPGFGAAGRGELGTKALIQRQHPHNGDLRLRRDTLLVKVDAAGPARHGRSKLLFLIYCKT